MSSAQPPDLIHSIIHQAKRSACGTEWEAMQGDEVSRVCPNCGARAYRLEKMDETAIVEASRWNQYLLGKPAYRRTDGAYIFGTASGCSPKKFLAAQAGDLRTSVIVHWWSARYRRFNKYLLWAGLFSGTVCTASLAMAAGPFAFIIFGVYAAFCGFVAHLLFGLGLLANIMIPKSLVPIRRHAGQVLLSLSMLASGALICYPLFYVIFGSSGLWNHLD